jgi:HicA toxin of bacterial toxin-antitoxin,
MVKAMRRRAVEAALRRHGCHVISESGAHAKWTCPSGEHSANIPRHREISPGVVRDTAQRMACLPEGWLR